MPRNFGLTGSTRRVALLGIAILVISAPVAVAGSDASSGPHGTRVGSLQSPAVARIDPSIIAAAQDGERVVRAVVSLRALSDPRSLNEHLLPPGSRLTAYFHAFRGLQTDYVGGYAFPDPGVPQDSVGRHLLEYERDHRAMLVTSLANARRALSVQSVTDQSSWRVVVNDFRSRLDEFDAIGLRVYGYIAEVDPRALLTLARVSPEIRSIRMDTGSRSIPSLPWKEDS